MVSHINQKNESKQNRHREHSGDPLNSTLELVAPGSSLREGLDRVLQAKHGALVIIGDTPEVLSICTGGFLLDAEFSPQRLAEVAKMDGAIILTSDASRIARANVHLVPKASIPTTETGTRHRTAERVAKSIDVPVITVSEAMAKITVYRNDRKHTTQPIGWLIDRAGQALSTLQRFKFKFDDALNNLSRLEMENSVSLRDVLGVLRPGEMIRRIADEIDGYLIELGVDGRLVELQMEEMIFGGEETLHLLLRDYVSTSDGSELEHGEQVRTDSVLARAERALDELRSLSADELLDLDKLASTIGLNGRTGKHVGVSTHLVHAPTLAGDGSGKIDLDIALEARGYRLLNRVPRLSASIIDRIVTRFGNLPGVMEATVSELEAIEGIGSSRARSIRQSLAGIIESSILERYQ